MLFKCYSLQNNVNLSCTDDHDYCQENSDSIYYDGSANNKTCYETSVINNGWRRNCIEGTEIEVVARFHLSQLVQGKLTPVIARALCVLHYTKYCTHCSYIH